MKIWNVLDKVDNKILIHYISFLNIEFCGNVLSRTLPFTRKLNWYIIIWSHYNLQLITFVQVLSNIFKDNISSTFST